MKLASVLSSVWSLLLLFTVWSSTGAEPLNLRVDFSRAQGIIRPLHGINKGPLAPGGLLDLTEAQRALGIPFTRLHDCHWPNPDVVDIHAVFPDFKADPERAESYDSRLTDEYIAATRATGAQIVYRLGESIEHTSVRRFVHPPADADKWAAICLGIIRHYNEGWANGFRHDIRYWEIWNEPENRPAMWSGTDEDYFRLYRVAARAIKARHPKLKIGGPSVGYSGQWKDGVFKPSAFVTNLLALCRRESLPLDFFSWHCYTDDPSEIAGRARGVRRMLDDAGFAATESHLNEWNFLPNNDWKPASRKGQGMAREKFYAEMGGVPGAAFIAATLIELQDAPLDVGNLFHGEAGGFGLFSENGVPNKAYFALLAFHDLLAAPRRVETHGALAGGLALVAGLNAETNQAMILVSNYRSPETMLRLNVENIPWRGGFTFEVRALNAGQNLEVAERGTGSASTPMELHLKAPAVALITLRPREERP